MRNAFRKYGAASLVAAVLAAALVMAGSSPAQAAADGIIRRSITGCVEYPKKFPLNQNKK